jgi:hypothetical protein
LLVVPAVERWWRAFEGFGRGLVSHRLDVVPTICLLERFRPVGVRELVSERESREMWQIEGATHPIDEFGELGQGDLHLLVGHDVGCGPTLVGPDQGEPEGGLIVGQVAFFYGVERLEFDADPIYARAIGLHGGRRQDADVIPFEVLLGRVHRRQVELVAPGRTGGQQFDGVGHGEGFSL